MRIYLPEKVTFKDRLNLVSTKINNCFVRKPICDIVFCTMSF